MCDQDHFEDDRQEYESRGMVTRREFGGAILGTGIAFLLPQVLNAVAVTESEVTVTTPDGTADCYFVHPASGTAAAVLFWPDIFGLRPAMRQMGKRLAESGYSVLVVNPFYRVQKAPTAAAGAKTEIKQLMPLAQGLNETTHMTDAIRHRGGGTKRDRTSHAIPLRAHLPVCGDRLLLEIRRAHV